MSKPKKKSDMTLVRLGPRLDRVVQILGDRNTMSFASTVRLLTLLGVRALIEAGHFQGWNVPEGLDEILDSETLEVQAEPDVEE